MNSLKNHWQKENKTNLGFSMYHSYCQKTHNLSGFWGKKSACANQNKRKNLIQDFWKVVRKCNFTLLLTLEGKYPLSYRQIRSHSALNSTFNSSALLLLYSSALRFAFTPSIGSPHFGKCGLKHGAR